MYHKTPFLENPHSSKLKKKKNKKKKKERKEKRKWQFRTQNMFLLVPWKVQLIKDILNLKKHS
jgi:hypothetical protein